MVEMRIGSPPKPGGADTPEQIQKCLNCTRPKCNDCASGASRRMAKWYQKKLAVTHKSPGDKPGQIKGRDGCN